MDCCDEEMLDNLSLPYLKQIYEKSSYFIKETNYKCFLMKCVEDIVELLNVLKSPYEVHTKWMELTPSINRNGDWTLDAGGIDVKIDPDDEVDLDDLHLPRLCLRLTFVKQIKCNYKCPHTMVTHQYVGLPKLTDMVNFYLRHPNWSSLIGPTYFPDFFDSVDGADTCDTARRETTACLDACDIPAHSTEQPCNAMTCLTLPASQLPEEFLSLSGSELAAMGFPCSLEF